MAISLANAIKSVKEDENWIKKVLLGGILTLIVYAASGAMEMQNAAIHTRVLWFLLYLFFGSLVSGFILSTGHKMLNSDSNKMTEWSEQNLIFKGFKYLLSWMVYCIAIGLIFLLISFVFTLIVCLVLGIIYFAINAIIPLSSELVKLLFILIFSTLFVVLMLYFMQFISVACTCYYKNLSFKNLMALKTHFNIIKENQHAAWTLVGKNILLMLLFILIAIIFCLTVIGIIALPFVCFATYIVIANLYAQYGKEIEVGKYLE